MAKISLGFLFLLALCIPVIVIWALNVLFHIGIDFTFETYFATLALLVLIFHNDSKG